MSFNHIFRLTAFTLVGNVAWATGNLLLGIWLPSAWFFTVGIYFGVLSIARLVVLLIKRSANDRFLRGFTGGILISLALPLTGMVILTSLRDRGTQFHMILMIAIALYAFVKITVAIVNLVRTRKQRSHAITALRNLSMADALVSIATLQRSMLVSFDGMTEIEIRIFNIATGTAVCLLVFLLGLNLLCGLHVDQKSNGVSYETKRP